MGLFILTGHLIPKELGDARPQPQSILLVGPPGLGKSQLLMRYQSTRGVVFRSDLTVRGLWRLLKLAEKRRITHVTMPEFNKVFQRKVATAMNCVGTLGEAMEEGVWDADVGPMQWSFNGARMGLIAGMTGRTLRRRRGLLYESGFLDRAAVIPWTLPDDQKRELLRRITDGDRTDLVKIRLPLPDKAVTVHLPSKVGLSLEKYVWERWPDESLRMLIRFRLLTMAAAMRGGRDVCRPDDVEEAVVHFADYWDKQIVTPAGDDEMEGE